MTAIPLRLWQGFASFRKTRPFWGALVLSLGAYFIAQPVMGADMEFYTTVGVRGITPMLLAGGMLAAAGVAICVPVQRHFPAIIASLLAVAAVPLANLGGWGLGTLFGIIGAGLVFAWTPYCDKQLEKFAARDASRAEKKAARAALKATA